MTRSHQPINFKKLYNGFSLPLSNLDCGEKCGPYNDYGVPVCCDIQLLIPSAYDLEWNYLQSETALWRLWSGSSAIEKDSLQQEAQPGQVLIQCLGHQHCQRSFRTITCRAFPFYPYLDSVGSFIGLAYYGDYREQCWIISNLSSVSEEYKSQFQTSFLKLFQLYPDTRDNFLNFSRSMRNQAANVGESIALLDFAGGVFIVDPITEKVQQISFQDLGSFGPFKIMKDLIFSDEDQIQESNKKK